jgi:2'-5' RNA ligase
VTGPAAARLFFALWPDDEVRAGLAERARAARGSAPGRPVPDANLHLTLAFLGQVEAARIAALTAAVDGLGVPAFELVIDRQGWWKRSGVLWLGPSAPPPALNRLVKSLWAALAPLDFWPDFRDFRPHVTVARRCRGGHGGELPPLVWPINAFQLMTSVIDRKGAAYRVHASWPLNPP